MLKLIHIDKTFHKGTINEMSLYKDFNITIQKGEFVTIIGSNGSGKSTFFNIIAGSLLPDNGTILFEGQNIAHQAEHIRSKRIARVFQDPMKGTAPSLTILENMSMAINKGKPFNLTAGVTRNQIECIKNELSKLQLDLEEKINDKVATLSGGQRQALSLLMATLVQPDLLLLDEHTAALDPKTSELILNLTQRLVMEKRITTLMVTHNLKQAIEVGNRLIMFHKGKVILDLNGQEKSSLTIHDLINKFNHLTMHDELSDDLLLN